VEHVLLFREPLGAASEKFGRLALAQLQAEGISRIDAVQAEALALGDAEGINVFLDALQDLSSRHGLATSHHGAAHCLGRLFKAIAPCLICDGLSDDASLLSRRGRTRSGASAPAPPWFAAPSGRLAGRPPPGRRPIGL